MGLVSEAASLPKRALELYDETIVALAERSPDAKPPVYLAVNRGRALETVGHLTRHRSRMSWRCRSQSIQSTRSAKCRRWQDWRRVAIQLKDTAAAAAYLDRTSAVLGSVEAADKTPKVALIRGRLALHEVMSLAEALRRFEAWPQRAAAKRRLWMARSERLKRC